MKENPIIDSVFLIQKLEICRDIHQCYLWAQNQLGEQFEEQMADLTKTIREHQFAHEKELNFFTSAWLMIMTDLPGEDDEAETLNKMLKAAVGWAVLSSWEERWGCHSPKRFSLLSECFDI